MLYSLLLSISVKQIIYELSCRHDHIQLQPRVLASIEERNHFIRFQGNTEIEINHFTCIMITAYGLRTSSFAPPENFRVIVGNSTEFIFLHLDNQTGQHTKRSKTLNVRHAGCRLSRIRSCWHWTGWLLTVVNNSAGRRRRGLWHLCKGLLGQPAGKYYAHMCQNFKKLVFLIFSTYLRHCLPQKGKPTEINEVRWTQVSFAGPIIQWLA